MKEYLDEEAFVALTSRASEEDRDLLYKMIKSFHAYVDTVVNGEAKFMLIGKGLQGQAYRDAMSDYDRERHSNHEDAIIHARVLNRLAAEYQLPPVFLGDDTQRHQVADFCLELEQYLFRNRRMKLS